MATEGIWGNPAMIVSICSAVLAGVAAWGPIHVYLTQKKRENLKAVTSLHDKWWSAEFADYRAVVWEHLELWKTMGSDSHNSPVILNYSRRGERWGLRDKRQIAHTRVLFFFCDVSVMLRRRLIDEDLAFEMLGVHQYSHYQDYFAAIREAINEATGLVKPPFFVHELAWFDRQNEKWKQGPGSRFKGYSGVDCQRNRLFPSPTDAR